MLRAVSCIYLGLTLFTLSCSNNSEISLIENQVRTASGIVEGIDGSRPGIRVFKGIPYAAPPLGNLRWKAPQPVVSWEGVFKADHFGNRCIQFNPYNIAGFGGDPENVTIFGESAGALSVTAFMASPFTKGLFQRAIGESGGFFVESNAPMLSLTAAEARGKELGKQLGATSIAELRAVAPEDLSKTQVDYTVKFGPIVDGYVLPASPTTIFASG